MKPDGNIHWKEPAGAEKKVPLRSCISWTFRFPRSGSFISWGTGTDGHINKMYNISYGKYVPFTKKLPLFLHIEDKLLYLNEKVRMIRGEDQEDAKVLGHQYEVTVEPYSQSREKQLKKKRTKAIFSQGKAGKKAVLVRKLYEIQNAKQKKQIWLISDRTTRGDDNGEVMFRYSAPIRTLRWSRTL